MDEQKSAQVPEHDLREITRIIKQMHLDDGKGEENEVQMRTTDGKICKFVE